MDHIFPFLENWPILSWALGVAAGFYVVVAFTVAHLAEEKRTTLSRWLQGSYDSSWASQFCTIFDRIFGEKHYMPRCMIWSSVFSILAVFALWVLFDQIFGLISLRSDTGLSLVQALLIGAAVNLIPDYISLFQTRYLLRLFEKFRNPFLQLGLLILDLFISGLIIYLGILAYLWITGEPQIAAVEMLAVFSIYAVFFYSTFLTSIWAWAFCLSSWVARISTKLRNWLPVRSAPGNTLALIGAMFIFAAALALKPALTMDERGRIPADEFFCNTFPGSACMHLVRLTDDEQEKLALLGKACLGGVTEECFDTGNAFFRVQPAEAARLWEKSCDQGDGKSCTNLGYLFSRSLGVDRDYSKAFDLYGKGCELGNALGCSNLGSSYRNAQGVKRDFNKARLLLADGCKAGDKFGCTGLGEMLFLGIGGERDQDSARSFLGEACKEGYEPACGSLLAFGLSTQSASASPDPARKEFARKCAAEEDAAACADLALIYENGEGVEANLTTAAALYSRACDLGYSESCKATDRLRATEDN